jgi:hypothetical protein
MNSITGSLDINFCKRVFKSSLGTEAVAVVVTVAVEDVEDPPFADSGIDERSSPSSAISLTISSPPKSLPFTYN